MTALYALTIMEMSLFALVGAFVYAFAGQYSEAPAVIVLRPIYKKIAFAFVLPPTVIIGIIVSRAQPLGRSHGRRRESAGTLKA